MALGRVTDQKKEQLAYTLYGISKNGMIHYNGRVQQRRKTFFINYAHKGLPKEVINRAPKEELERYREWAGEKAVEAFAKVKEKAEKEETKKMDALVKAEAEEAQNIKSLVEAKTVQKTQPISVPVDIKSDKHGLSLQLNITINLNN